MKYFGANNTQAILDYAEEKGLNVYIGVKRPIPIKVVEMDEDFEIETLEGAFSAPAGAFIAIGNHEDAWPVQRHIFLETYDMTPIDKWTPSDEEPSDERTAT